MTLAHLTFSVGLCLTVALFVRLNSADDTTKNFWNYEDTDNWANFSEICAMGSMQSPINIIGEEAMYSKELDKSPLTFASYKGKLVGTLSNDAHKARFKLHEANKREKRPRIWHGGYGSEGYILEEIDFHWGSDPSSKETSDHTVLGSEHSIDGHGAPMEVQFVHYNGLYESFEDARYHADGIAIIAFLFDTSNGSDSDSDKTDYMQIASQLSRVSKEGSSVFIKVDIGKLLPKAALQDGKYYRYVGSLTEPPCSETVSWTVFDDRIQIDSSTVKMFMSSMNTRIWTPGLWAADGTRTWTGNVEPLQNNYRPLQDNFGRVVRTNKPYTVHTVYYYDS